MSPAQLLIIDHGIPNNLGAFEPVLHDLAIETETMREDSYPDFNAMNGIVVLGGVDDICNHPLSSRLFNVCKLLQEAQREKIPILGICMGAELLSLASGLSIRRQRVKSVGWYPVYPLAEDLLEFNGLSDIQFFWNQNYTDGLRNTNILGQSKNCPSAIFQPAPGCYGIQFHPEITMPAILDWLGQSCSLTLAQKMEIRDEARRHLPFSQKKNQEWFRQFCRQVFLGKEQS